MDLDDPQFIANSNLSSEIWPWVIMFTTDYQQKLPRSLTNTLPTKHQQRL
ncbi:hypothetical protein HanRHA438_Chr01g0044451 [Helianthus annuus]|nr:hypothetical protein HanRHA438_Chr01g0044451 [Helianthus annuus]